ncbi:unnamed protein product [Caenorhabditis bovis]|uniref:Uncharacterized protein n=1 Tax=Caenorhabditis bovis TaxID=2654633 RepID=A0A8S1F6S2_9PELO|nr:unnamed protein product [Caenorhabditis bovis]
MPHIVPGCLHPSNSANSIDWNEGGLIAHASHNVILIIDVFKFKRIQSIDIHQSAVNIVKWCPQKSPFAESAGNQLQLASSDISGQIIVSNALTAQKSCQFSHPNSSVLQICWFPWKDISRDFLLVLHSGSHLILWNTQTAEKVWSHAYSHIPLHYFTLDPFTLRNAVFSSDGNKVLICSDIALAEPQSSGFLFSVTNEETSNIFLLAYHKAYRNIVFAAINNMLYLINPELMCVVSKIAIESNLVGCAPLSRRDALIGVHANGAITLRIGAFEGRDDLRLTKIAQTECIRHGGAQKIVAAVVCPATQSTIAVLYQTGKLAFWQLKNEKTPLVYRAAFIEDFLRFDDELVTTPIGELSLHQLARIGAFSSGVTCVRMRPMDELAKLENDEFANTKLGTVHLAAVGTNSGVVHLVDVFTAQIYRDICVQSSPIKCLEWGGVYSLVTAGYNHSLSASQVVRNEVFITDIRTGIGRRIRPEVDESPISIIRVSYYHCYLAIAFQREPLEIWDLKGLRLLRRMSRSCPLIIDMAWSNKHHGIRTTESTQQSVYRENLVLLDSENRIYHITLRGLHVRDGKMVNTQWKSASSQICSMAWKDDMLAVGDVEGSLVVWDLGKRQSRQVRDVSHSRIMKMAFSRLAGDHTMAVLHAREVTLWDTEAMTRFQSIRTDASRWCLDADLCGISPLVLTNDSHLRLIVSDAKNAHIADKDVPFLCNDEILTEIRRKFADAAVGDDDDDNDDETPIMAAIRWLLKTRRVVSSSSSSSCDVTRLRNERLVQLFAGNRFGADVLAVICDKLAPNGEHLAPDLQLFWNNEDFKKRESRVICAACDSPSALEGRLVEQAVVVGGVAKEKVTDRLIVSSDLRYSSIKAALLVSNQDNEKAKSLIKLIATNLIASDMIEDGVELLFLVGSGGDACKYLQSQKLWTQSIVYAKMGLSDPSEVESKWIGHLVEVRQTRVLACAARRDWPIVVDSISAFDATLARMILQTTTSSPP